MPASRRHILQAAVATALAPALPARAQAGTAKIAVGFAAGGTVDAIGRRLADKLRGGYAETVIVDNRAGAGGRLALELTKRAPADGLSSVLTPSSMMVVYPHVYRNLSYDPQLDFLPVTTVCANALAFVVGPGVPDSVTSLKQFVAWAKGRKSAHGATRAAFHAVLAMLLAQVGLGIATALTLAHVHVAITHQIGAVILWVLILRARHLSIYPIAGSIREGTA